MVRIGFMNRVLLFATYSDLRSFEFFPIFSKLCSLVTSYTNCKHSKLFFCENAILLAVVVLELGVKTTTRLKLNMKFLKYDMRKSDFT